MVSDDKVIVLKNSDVKRVICLIPKKHRHIRLILEYDNVKLVLQEATISAIVRSFIDLKHHPTRRAVELVSKRLSSRKEGYADHQLVESGRSEDEVLREAEELF
jgi:hypothetical protein